MPSKTSKIDIKKLLSSPIIPSLDEIKYSLGLKSGRKLAKLLTESDKTHANIFIGFGKLLEDTTDNPLYKSLLCYALAAQQGGILGFKACNAALNFIEDKLFRQELWNPDAEMLIPFFNDKKIEIQNTPMISINTPHTHLTQLLQEAESLKNMVLARRLDLYYEIYKTCEKILSINEPDQQLIKSVQLQALTFMESVLDMQDIKEIESAMQKRVLRKSFDPEFIPGVKVAQFTQTIDAHQALTQAQFLWRRSAETVLGSKNRKILTVNERSKEKDRYEKTVFLNAEQRDGFRAIIHNGIFYERELDNSFCNYDTTKNLSKSGRGYGAFVLNTRGEFSIFNHTGGDVPFYHTSLNAQAPVFFAGEIKIENGKLKAITSYSGHYQPDKENMLQLLFYLKRKNIDLSDVYINLHYRDQESNEAILKYNADDFIHHPNDAKEIREDQPNSISELGSTDWADFDEIRSQASSSSTISSPTPQSTATTTNDFDSSNWSDFDSPWDEAQANSPTSSSTDSELSTSNSSNDIESEDWADFDSVNSEIKEDQTLKGPANNNILTNAISMTLMGSTASTKKILTNKELPAEKTKKLYK